MAPCPKCNNEIQFRLMEQLSASSAYTTCPNCGAELRATIGNPWAWLLVIILTVTSAVVGISISVIAVYVDYPFIPKWSLTFGVLITVATVFFVPVALILKKWAAFRPK